MLREEAGDLIGIAEELERRALTHEKVVAHLDLPRARVLRDLAARIREVVETSERNGDRDAVHGEVVGLRLEAMCALLEKPVRPPPVSQPVSSGPRLVEPPGRGTSAAEAAGRPIARIRGRG